MTDTNEAKNEAKREAAKAYPKTVFGANYFYQPAPARNAALAHANLKVNKQVAKIVRYYKDDPTQNYKVANLSFTSAFISGEPTFYHHDEPVVKLMAPFIEPLSGSTIRLAVCVPAYANGLPSVSTVRNVNMLASELGATFYAWIHQGQLHALWANENSLYCHPIDPTDFTICNA